MKINNKKWESCENEEKISYANELFNDAKVAREKREVEWYLNYRFLEGDHYVYYNTVTNSLERLPKKRGEVRVVVNKIKAMIRAVQNYTTRFNPKWEVIPGDLDESTIKNARRAGKVLDYIDTHLHLEIMRAALIETGLNTSVAFVELDWDENADAGLGQVRVMLHDSFNVYVDPSASIYGGLIKGRFVAKSTRKAIEEIKNDERYDKKARKNVVKDDSLSDSALKTRIITQESNLVQEKTERAVVREFYLYDDEGSKNSKIRLFTYCGKEVLRDEMLKEVEFPIYCFQIPQDTKKIYHRSWTADIVPLNKVLDRIVSQKVMYINQALVYRIIAEKGHGATPITNEMGMIMEVNAGRKWEQQPLHPMPLTADRLEGDVNKYIEDMGGAHEAALGSSPSGARSGAQLEALQAADSNNLAGIRLSMESFLAVLGSKILDIIAEKYVASRVIRITDPEEGEEGPARNYLEVMGAGAPKEAQKEGAVIINKDNELIVKIGSWLGYTVEAQRETLMKLAETGIIPADEVLRQFEFTNINELSAKARDQRLEQHQLDAEIAGRNQQEQAPAPEQQKGGIDMVALADKENMQMMQGEQLPPTEGADLNHTMAHRDFMSSQTFKTEADETIQQVFVQHVQGELAAHGMTQ